MLIYVARILLHGGGHSESGAVSFETVLGGLVALLVVTGALWYLGVFESLDEGGEGFASVEAEADPDSERGN